MRPGKGLVGIGAAALLVSSSWVSTGGTSTSRGSVAWGFGGRDRLAIGQISDAASGAGAGGGKSSAAGGATAGYGQGGAAGGSDSRQDALRRLMWELEKRTSIEVSPEAAPVSLSDAAALHRHPLLYWSSDRAFVAPSEDDVARLRRHLQMGGMLLFDSAEGRAGGGFDQSVRALVARLFPNAPLKRLPEDHVIYKAFYLLRVPFGRVIAQPYLEAVQLGGRAAIVYSQNDLGGAWARDRFGQWYSEVVPGGEPQREQAFRLGVNLVMYSLCLDYKEDQVHVPFVMRRRLWQAPQPKISPAPGGALGRDGNGSSTGGSEPEPAPSGSSPGGQLPDHHGQGESPFNP